MSEVAAYLERQARTVQMVTRGNPTQVETTGFRLKQVNARRFPLPGQVQRLRLRPEGEGALLVRWQPQRRVTCYEVEISLEPGTPTYWEFIGSVSRARKTLGGFAGGTRVWVRVCARRRSSAGPWSDPVALRVL